MGDARPVPEFTRGEKNGIPFRGARIHKLWPAQRPQANDRQASKVSATISRL